MIRADTQEDSSRIGDEKEIRRGGHCCVLRTHPAQGWVLRALHGYFTSPSQDHWADAAFPLFQRWGNWAQRGGMTCPRKLVMEPEEKPKSVWLQSLRSSCSITVPPSGASRCEWWGPDLQDRLQESFQKKELYRTMLEAENTECVLCVCCVSALSIHEMYLFNLAQPCEVGFSRGNWGIKKVFCSITQLGIVELG